MKKAIFILAAVMVLFSGVAAVSAYEAHIINVTSHVENAMVLTGLDGTPPDYKLEFGTVFPEEWIVKDFMVNMSESFCSYENHLGMDYAIWVLPKPHPDDGFYPWLGDALYLGISTGAGFKEWPNTAAPPGDLTHVGYSIPTGPILTSQLWKPAPQHQKVVVGLDVPVFEGYYNPYTDPEPKPSKLDDPTVIILKGSDRYPANIDDGVTLGVEIKIQVTKIYRSSWTPYP